MKRIIYVLLLSTLSLTAQETEKNRSFSLGLVSNINDAQLGLRATFFPNNKLGYYAEVKQQDFGYTNYKGSELTVEQLTSEPNLNFEGIKYSRTIAFNVGAIIPINSEINFYNGIGMYQRKAFAQLSRETAGEKDHYHVFAHDKFNFYYNVGFELKMMNLIYNVGYDLGLSKDGDLEGNKYDINFKGLNIGVSYRIKY